MPERVYTTLDIAKVCRVSLRTVIRWVDEGKLASFRTPGGHRRVREQHLVNFLSEYNFPFPVRESHGPKRILIVEQEHTIKRVVQNLLRRATDIPEIYYFENPYEAAVRIGFLQPHLVILAIKAFTPDVETFCRIIRKVPETKGIKILILNLSKNGVSKKTFLSMGVNAVIARPFTTDTVRESVLRLLGESEYSA